MIASIDLPASSRIRKAWSRVKALDKHMIAYLGAKIISDSDRSPKEQLEQLAGEISKPDNSIGRIIEAEYLDLVSVIRQRLGETHNDLIGRIVVAGREKSADR